MHKSNYAMHPNTISGHRVFNGFIDGQSHRYFGYPLSLKLVSLAKSILLPKWNNSAWFCSLAVASSNHVEPCMYVGIIMVTTLCSCQKVLYNIHGSKTAQPKVIGHGMGKKWLLCIQFSVVFFVNYNYVFMICSVTNYCVASK